MTGYHGDPDRTAEAMAGGYYRTGDVGSRDDDGYITYVGRADDVFKASDYKISPFELESALLEHEAVAEAAVVPAPDELRLAVPKAYVVLAEGWEPARTPPRCCSSTRGRSSPLQAHPPPGVRRPAQDRLRQDPPDRAARGDGGGVGRRVPRGGLPVSAEPLVRARHERHAAARRHHRAPTWTGRSRPGRSGTRWSTWRRAALDVRRIRRGRRRVGARAAGAAGSPRATGSGIWAVNCPEWVLVQYATARIGAIMVNINPAYRTHEVEYVLKQAGISRPGRLARSQDQRLPGAGRAGPGPAPTCAAVHYIGDRPGTRCPGAADACRRPNSPPAKPS